jgi:hypothetical protein
MLVASPFQARVLPATRAYGHRMDRRWVAVLPVGALLMTGVPHASASSSAQCQVRIARWVFDPNSVAPGGQTQLILTLRNCTEQRRRVSVMWFGSGQNCPTIDPAPPTSMWLGPEGRKTKTWPFTAPPCGSSGGQEDVTVRVSNKSGRQLATRTTKLTVTAG